VLIRLNVDQVRVMGRATQGVRLINLTKKNDTIASVCKVQKAAEDEDDVETATPDQVPDEPLVDFDENDNEIVEGEQE
jgi:DNA gyrase subunit A